MNNLIETFEINSLPLHSIKTKDLFLLIESLFHKNLPLQLITINIDFLRISSQNMEFRNLCRNSSFNFIDGVPVKWLINLLYKKKCELVTGHLLFDECLKYSQFNHLRVALVGSTDKIVNKVEENICKNYPSVEVLSVAPSFLFEMNEEENTNIIERLRNFSPHFTFVSLGCPRQEFWINSYKDIIGSRINVGVGSAFKVYSGEAKRAPLFLQRAGLEWFWRFLHEPIRLFNRYFIRDIPFFVKLLFKILTKRPV